MADPGRSGHRLIDPLTQLPGAVPWATEITQRMRRYAVLKLLGVTAFISIFFVGYLHLLRHPLYPVTVMPLTALDRLIPFQPAALAAYVSLWLYIGIAPGLMLRLRELADYALWISAMSLTGLACFYFWPTAVPPLALEVSGYVGFSVLQGIDAAGNACPSMHVAAAMFTAIWIEHLLRQARVPPALRWANGAWFVTIAWSTLAIKQHVALDLLAGALLGAAFALPALRWRPAAGRRGAAPV